TSSNDKTLRLWDADTGKQLRVFEGHTEYIASATLSADGKRALSGSSDIVRLWDADTGKEFRRMTAVVRIGFLPPRVVAVTFGPEGKAIAACDNGTVQVWDMNTGKNTGVYEGHTLWVGAVAYSDKAKLAATCGADR